jgi:hypothetical protein
VYIVRTHSTYHRYVILRNNKLYKYKALISGIYTSTPVSATIHTDNGYVIVPFLNVGSAGNIQKNNKQKKYVP